MKRLSEEIGLLNEIASLYGLKLHRLCEYRKAVRISIYLDYKINRELTKLKIK